MGRGTVQRGGRATLVADDRLAHRWPPARVSAAAGGRDRQRDGRFLLRGSPERDPPARRRGWVGAGRGGVRFARRWGGCGGLRGRPPRGRGGGAAFPLR